MITPRKIQKMKLEGKKITALTAYDYPVAKFAKEAGVDLILVGDSAAQVVMGYESTVQISMDEMKVFARSVLNGAKESLVVIDMPFLSYHISIEEAIKNAGEFIKMGASAVKIEGCNDYILELIARLTQSGIPVLAHLGFTAQYINAIGGNLVQGKSLENTLKILDDAKKLQSKGAFAVVLELIPDVCAKYITENLEIPTIGIGAGKYTDGQILVVNDILGQFDSFSPKFARKYADLKEIIVGAIKNYTDDVKCGKFPTDDESFQLTKEEYEKFESYTNN